MAVTGSWDSVFDTVTGYKLHNTKGQSSFPSRVKNLLRTVKTSVNCAYQTWTLIRNTCHKSYIIYTSHYTS
jgi:hypothetical protein